MHPAFDRRKHIAISVTRRLNVGTKVPMACHTKSRPGGTLSLGMFGPNRVTSATKASNMMCNIGNAMGFSSLSQMGAFTRIGRARRRAHLNILLYVGKAKVLGS